MNKAITSHPEENMNVWDKSYGNPTHSCWDILTFVQAASLCLFPSLQSPPLCCTISCSGAAPCPGCHCLTQVLDLDPCPYMDFCSLMFHNLNLFLSAKCSYILILCVVGPISGLCVKEEVIQHRCHLSTPEAF